MSNLKVWIESVHPPHWTRARHRTGVRWERTADSLPSPPSGDSPCTCARSLCAGHRTPGSALPLPTGLIQPRILWTVLTSTLGAWWMFLELPCWISEPRHHLTLPLCTLLRQRAESDSWCFWSPNCVPMFSFQLPRCSLFTLLTNFLASYKFAVIRAT